MKKLEKLLARREAELNAEHAAFIEAERKRKSNNSEAMFLSILASGFSGLFIGAFLGYCKGCKSYGQHSLDSSVNGHDILLEPFWYIPENALYVALIGGALGILIGFSKRK